MKRYIGWALFWLLGACTPIVAPVDVTRGVETAVFPTPLAADTPTALASLTSIAPLIPTTTPLPTSTTAVDAALLPTPTTAVDAALNPTAIAVDGVEILWAATSPSGEWVATTSYEVPEGMGQFQTRFWLTNQASGAAWLLLDDLRPLGMGYTTPKVLAWAEDETAVFFSEAGRADGGGLFEYHHGLWRGSLVDGNVTELVPADTADVAVAPAGKTAVSAAYNSPDLLIYDLATGAVESVLLPAPFDLIGGLVWSPSGEQLAVTLVVDPFESRHTIVHYRRADWQPTVLLADETTHRFVTEGWVDEATVLLQALDGAYWRLDVARGEVTIMTE